MQKWYSPNLRHYLIIRLEEIMKKEMKNLNSASWYDSWDLNRELPKFKSEALPLAPTCSVQIDVYLNRIHLWQTQATAILFHLCTLWTELNERNKALQKPVMYFQNNEHSLLNNF
jgi:hypothetical protein